jgi:hypothetical protein
MVIRPIPRMPLPFYDDWTLLEFIGDITYLACDIITDTKLSYKNRIKLIDWLTIKEVKKYCIENGINPERFYNSEFNMYLELVEDFRKEDVESLLYARTALESGYRKTKS